jgi:DNA mismatch repair protein MutL
MPSIHVLSPDVRGKIAAGEVIIRPASVIKELVENSLDALAMRIEVEIVNGGKDKCLVNDDGQGMSREDAQLALERYATSKIARIEDIDDIRTYGFRGEALASIAHVSRFEMETSDGRVGTRIIAEGGVVRGSYDSQRPRGTRIKVADLFYNLPARRKFLKSISWERRLISNIVKEYALIHPEVFFTVIDGAKTMMNLTASDSMRGRARLLLSKQVADQLIGVDVEVGTVRISGLMSRPDLAENHRFHYIFVNSRPVKYPFVYRTVMDAYENPKNVPAFAINIQSEPQFVDANVHPAKSEVKFKDERYVADLITQVIKREVFRRPVSFDHELYEHDQPAIASTAQRFVQDVAILQDDRNYISIPGLDEFWQLHNTYILAQTKSGLIIVDQHVAHERILYEAVMKGQVQSQRLLFPVTIELTPAERAVYQKTRQALHEMGIEFKEFSSNTVVVDSVPADFSVDREQIAGIFSELVGLGDLISERSRVASIVACRGAIKAGQKLTVQQMQSLIDRLFATDNPYTCPHGRPIVIKLTLEELGHKFGRS